MIARLSHLGLMRAWLVYHKHPCGSSGGSLVAVAAGSSPLAFGSETQGSIKYPASFIALNALEPATGLTSHHGLLRSSTAFDALGKFGNSVWDVAYFLAAVAGYDMKDPVSLEALAYELHDYTTNLASEWSDWRLGSTDRKWF